MFNKSSITQIALTVAIAFLLIVATSFGTIKVMDHRESVLLNRENALSDNKIKETIGGENFEELDRIETKVVTDTTYYKKDGTVIVKDREVSEGTANYNNY